MDSQQNPDLLTAPDIDYSLPKIQHFDTLFHAALAQGAGTLIPTTAPYPTHEFLCYLVQHKNCLLHGSNLPAIAQFEPRQQTDYEGRVVNAVFAADDGIWPIYFAILDRSRYKGSMRNACTHITDASGAQRSTYRFSINAELLPHYPWCEGTIYVLARDSFRPVLDEAGQPLAEWTSPNPVQPLARIRVAPTDFPFLQAVKGHDDRLTTIGQWLFTTYEADQEIADGYAFRYTWTTEWATQTIIFIELLRQVDPAIQIDLVCEPNQGPIWLRLHGSDVIKARVQHIVEQVRNANR